MDSCLRLHQELLGPGLEEELQLIIQPSSVWCAQDVQQVSSIIQHRNQFVCMQLVTMVKEQFARLAAATAAGDEAALHATKFIWLGTLTSSHSKAVLAAGIFYPRACSKDGADMPHVYVELICCNSPGKGLGSLLLQHIEQFVADNCNSISEGFFGVAESAAGGTVPMQDVPSAPCMDISTPSGAGMDGVENATTAQQSEVPQRRRSYSSLPVLLPDDLSTTAAAAVVLSCLPPAGLTLEHPAGMCLSASSSSICSLASNLSTSTVCSAASTGSATSMLATSMGHGGSCSSLASMQLALPAQDCPAGAPAVGNVFASGLSCDCGNGVAVQGIVSLVGAISGQVTAAGPGGSASIVKLCQSCKLIQGIKLLSVQSAQGFYTKCGYGAPDSCCEMFKPLASLEHSMPAALPHQAAF
jgi:hypothetical protein